MKTLYELDNSYTDKGNVHSYYETYTNLFENRRYVKHVMEVGVREGGSLKLWLDYFPEAIVYGIDSDTECVQWHLLDQFTGRFMVKFADAYDKQTAESYSDTKFDILIDDGSHTLEHQKCFIDYYFDLLKHDGVMIIEDIEKIEYCDVLYNCVPEEYRDCVSVYDLRTRKNRYDDILFVIDKKSKT